MMFKLYIVMDGRRIYNTRLISVHNDNISSVVSSKMTNGYFV